MLDLFHLVTTGNFQIEKQNKMSRWSSLVCIIKLLPGGVASAQLMLSKEEMLRL